MACLRPRSKLCEIANLGATTSNNCHVPVVHTTPKKLLPKGFDFHNIASCQTLSYDDLTKTLTTSAASNCFVLSHFNMRSLQKNFDDLADAVYSLNSAPTVIALSETKLKSDPILNVSLEGYTFLHSPTKSNAGGVGIYVKKNIGVHMISCYNLDYDDCEQLWVELTGIFPNNKPLLVGVIYRHPKANVNTFRGELEHVLSQIGQHSQRCLMSGDINLN